MGKIYLTGVLVLSLILDRNWHFHEWVADIFVPRELHKLEVSLNTRTLSHSIADMRLVLPQSLSTVMSEQLR